MILDACLLKSLSYRSFRAIANLIEQLAFSLNFLVYYAMNKNFKDFMQKMLVCSQCLKSKGTVTPTTS